MTEKEQIVNNNNGELPKGVYDIVRIKNIPNPEQELNTFKQTVIAFLENKNLAHKMQNGKNYCPNLW